MHVFYNPLRRVVVFEVNRLLVLLYVQCIEDVDFLQKLAMLEVFVIFLRRSLLNIYDQSRSLGTAVPASSSFFDFLDLFTSWSMQ